jgi:hypothetical protein
MCEVNYEVDLLEGDIHLYLDSLPWMPPKEGLVAAPESNRGKRGQETPLSSGRTIPRNGKSIKTPCSQHSALQPASLPFPYRLVACRSPSH